MRKQRVQAYIYLCRIQQTTNVTKVTCGSIRAITSMLEAH